MYRKIGIFAVINSTISFKRNWPRLEHTTTQIRNIWITVGEELILYHNDFQYYYIRIFFVHSARHAFENCVYTSAKLKCRMDSAIFIRKLSKLLSTEKQFSNCDKVEEQLCSIASAITLNFLLIFFFILFRFYWFLHEILNYLRWRMTSEDVHTCVYYIYLAFE